MQSVSSRIWTRVAVSISYNDNYYIMGTSLKFLYDQLFLRLELPSITVLKNVSVLSMRLQKKGLLQRL